MSRPSAPSLLAVAARLLPAKTQGRYLAEWAAESEAIRSDVGVARALTYRLDVLFGAPRLAFALRATQRPSDFDKLVVSITLLVPIVLHLIHATLTEQAPLAVVYLMILVGLVAFAQGLWSPECGLAGKLVARVGLLVVTVGAVGVPVVNRVTETVTPMSTAPFETFPGTLMVSLGAGLLLLSSGLEHRRVAIAHFGLLVLMAGLFTWGAAAMANSIAASTWIARGYHASIVPSALLVFVVCVRVRRAGASLVVPSSKGRVIPHQ